MSSKKSAKDILCFSTSQIHCQIHGSLLKSVRFGKFLIASKILDARRRGATSEAYGAIRRKEERSKATPQMMPLWWIRAHLLIPSEEHLI